MPKHKRHLNVFLNLPFDQDYKPLFEALVFAVFDCGYIPRCALEQQDGGQVRIEKLKKLIVDSDKAIHDISRTELDPKNKLPRFNMPFELGLYLGAKWFGNLQNKGKNCLIFDRDRYRYQKFISDIAGQDVKGHGNNPLKVVEMVRDWLKDASPAIHIPGGLVIYKKYKMFRKELPFLCKKLKLKQEHLKYNDYAYLVSLWLQENSRITK
jgi:hypothetical protein